MDQLTLKLEKDSEGYENVQIYINGKNLISILKRIESQYDKKIAGQYKGLPPEIVYSPSTHLLGVSNQDLDYHDDKSVLLICECGVAGCWDFVVKISTTDEVVSWSEFEQSHRGPESVSGHWKYDELSPFVFNRKQYESALHNMK